MITIKLMDARRGLYNKCRELFTDSIVSDSIYHYLCDGIEECEYTEPERNKGKWKDGCCTECGYNWGKDAPIASVPNYCPNCGADMGEETTNDIHD